MDLQSVFPQIKKEIKDYLTEEEGNISRSKILTIGSLVVMLSVLLMDEVFAYHSSHSSHSSHASHASHSSSYTDGHASHASHASHVSHTSSTDYTYPDSVVDYTETAPPAVVDYETLYNLPTPQTPPDTPIINE